MKVNWKVCELDPRRWTQDITTPFYSITLACLATMTWVWKRRFFAVKDRRVVWQSCSLNCNSGLTIWVLCGSRSGFSDVGSARLGRHVHVISEVIQRYHWLEDGAKNMNCRRLEAKIFFSLRNVLIGVGVFPTEL